MRPLSDWPLADRRHLLGVFTDIDDTLTTQGIATPDALQALQDLSFAGLNVIPITGRSVGWCAPFSPRTSLTGTSGWPVDAIVAENGSVALLPNRNAIQPSSDMPGTLSKIYQQDDATRRENLVRMRAVAAQILDSIPQARLSQDNPGRETDMAVDHHEHTHLEPQQIEAVAALMREAGMQATVSSIHINGWFGTHNKLEGARWIVSQLWGRDLDSEMDRWAYVGDSANDQLMFQHFKHSVGVANIRDFEHQLYHWPRYVTPSDRGAGFAEVAQVILEARQP